MSWRCICNNCGGGGGGGGSVFVFSLYLYFAFFDVLTGNFFWETWSLFLVEASCEPVFLCFTDPFPALVQLVSTARLLPEHFPTAAGPVVVSA